MKGIFQAFTRRLLKERGIERGNLPFGSYESKPLVITVLLMNFDELNMWNSGAKAFFSYCDPDFHGVWVKKHLKKF